MELKSTKRDLRSTGRAGSIDSHTNQLGRSSKNFHIVGRNAEEYVAKLLQENGVVILERNFFCKFAEIDLIVLTKKVVCFIEVKCSVNGSNFPIVERVDEKKISKISNCAAVWIQINPKYTMYEQALILYEISYTQGDFSVANITEVRV